MECGYDFGSSDSHQWMERDDRTKSATNDTGTWGQQRRRGEVTERRRHPHDLIMDHPRRDRLAHRTGTLGIDDLWNATDGRRNGMETARQYDGDLESAVENAPRCVDGHLNRSRDPGNAHSNRR